ncbi:MAG: MBOAT family protein [Firmicutes bacterium]|nr:MBOAT family protein [Bacillota bacterium]
MVFSSLPFLFIFISLTCLFYFAFRSLKWRNGVLLFASLVFYSWGEPKLVLLMALVVLAAWAGGLGIDALKDRPKARRACFIGTVSLITLNLAVFKYLGFLVSNINGIFGPVLTVPVIELPIGISFYTFQILSYVIDLYKGNVGVQKSFPRLLLYVSFFPQLIAGPIVRYSTVESEIGRRKEDVNEIAWGLRRFITGLAKKVIISNGVARFAEIVYAGDPQVYGRLMYWLAAIAYSLQLYFDFSGYSDMAIGLGRIFGFHFLENFDHPYVSCSITEFWRRWHISLSTWFRDYIYIPLGGSRVSRGRWFFNIMVVWSLTGLWHGASWNFVFWGLYYGLLLALEKLVTGRLMAKLPRPISWLITMFIVILGWTIFDLTDPAALATALRTMFAGGPFRPMDVLAANTGIIEGAFYIPLGLIFMFPVGKLFKKIESSAPGLILANLWSAALLILCCVYMFGSSFNPFIYFRF